MESPWIWQLNQLLHVLLAGITLVLVVLWPSCRSRILLILAIAFGAVPSALWFLFNLMVSLGRDGDGRILVPVQVLSVLASLAAAILLLVFAVLMRSELGALTERQQDADIESLDGGDTLPRADMDDLNFP